MMRPISRTAAALFATLVSAASAGAAPVNRPLADALTQQFNQQELQAMEIGSPGVYSRADLLNGQQLGQPVAVPPPPAMYAPPMAPPPAWSYLPR